MMTGQFGIIVHIPQTSPSPRNSTLRRRTVLYMSVALPYSV